ncbi:helix-turn-helix transcriptional regulator [Pseudomonas sp. F1_0610]|uniref:XRE family transcriptional regulator n=1 Tax=Pseudomonas sp. F1_0610 TaxID=3114284 RepID=UPI0039C0DC23
MFETLADRIRHCAELAGSGDELARLATIPRRTLEYYMTGEREPKLSRCVDIAKVVKVNLDWLATGEGDITKSKTSKLAEDDKYAYIPLYDAVCSAGGGAWNGKDQILTHISFTQYSLRKKGLIADQLSAVRIKGDSMEPLLHDNDTVLIDHTQSSITADGIYVIRVDEHLYAKRLQRQINGSILVISENSAYKPMTVNRDALGDLAIIGRVVWSAGWM